MCFTNLPVEFDGNGDPYLTDEAEAVSDPGDCDHDHASAGAGTTNCGCAVEADALDDADPEAAYEQILDSVTAATRSHLTESGDHGDGQDDRAAARTSAEGD